MIKSIFHEKLILFWCGVLRTPLSASAESATSYASECVIYVIDVVSGGGGFGPGFEFRDFFDL